MPSTAIESTAASSAVVASIIAGSVCALLLVTTLALLYRRSYRMPQQSGFSPPPHNTVADRLALNRHSIYKSGIWQSIDLGRRNHHMRPDSVMPAIVAATAAKQALPHHNNSMLDGYEAAASGYDPDAQMIKFDITVYDSTETSPTEASEDVNEDTTIEVLNGDVMVGFEEARQIVPDEDEFYHQLSEPEPAHHLSDLYASAPSPLYTEFPAGEQW